MPDELLSSWLIRLALGNGSKVQSFCAEFFGRDRQIWTRDIDHHAPDWLIRELSLRTGVSIGRISAMTLRSFESYAFERFNETGITRWLTPLGVYHRTRTAYGLQFCPLCLRTDERPNFRRRWRLALSMVCVQHGALLHDRCGSCGKPVTPHRIDMVSRWGLRAELSMQRCTFCGSTLAASAKAVTADEVGLQRHIDETLERGYAVVQLRPLYSHLYFDGLRLLMAVLHRIEGAGRDVGFERVARAIRLARMKAAVRLTERWPEALIARCETVPHPYSIFTQYAKAIPFWIAEVLRRDLLQAWAPLSMAEARAISAAAARATGSTALSMARAFSGRDVGELLPAPTVSDEVAESLLRSLSREIQRSTRLRFALLVRDAAMFLIGRTRHLSVRELLALSIDECRFTSDSGIWERPTNIAIDRYLQSARPYLTNSLKVAALFVGVQGRPLRPSAVGMRLNRAKRVAQLDGAISSWHAWAASTRVPRRKRLV